MAINSLSTGFRPGVCTFGTRPTAPYEGQVIYETDTDLSYVYNGSSWQQVSGGTAVGNSGLVYVAETSFTTLGTAFINGCFTNTYANYRVMISCIGTASIAVAARMRSGTSTPETGLVYDRFGIETASTYSNINTNDLSSALIGAVESTGAGVMTSVFDVFNPNVAMNTNLVINGWNATNGVVYIMNNRIQTSTQYTGIEISPGSGTITGSMRVYGYRQG